MRCTLLGTVLYSALYTSTKPRSAFCLMPLISFLNRSSAGMLARAKYLSGFGQVFLSK